MDRIRQALMRELCGAKQHKNTSKEVNMTARSRGRPGGITQKVNSSMNSPKIVGGGQ